MVLNGIFHISNDDLNDLKETIPPVTPIKFAVSFPNQFPSPPQVTLGLSGFDGGGDRFIFRFVPVNITQTGFEIHLYARRSWLRGLDISWLAIHL